MAEQMRSTMETNYGDVKWSKQRELNDSMSIVPSAPDELTNTIDNVFGGAR